MLIENAPGSAEDHATPDAGGARSLEASACAPATPLVLYTGTFEAYQGLDLLFAAMAIVQGRAARRAAAAGRRQAGSGATGAASRRERAGIGDVTIFAGERPAGDIPAYLLAADVLVSPRSRGTNTPLKIYQYLRSGRPIVATRLLTHTQVLSDETAILTGASAGEFAAGILVRDRRPGRGGRHRPAGAASSPKRSTATRPISRTRELRALARAPLPP